MVALRHPQPLYKGRDAIISSIYEMYLNRDGYIRSYNAIPQPSQYLSFLHFSPSIQRNNVWLQV